MEHWLHADMTSFSFNDNNIETVNENIFGAYILSPIDRWHLFDLFLLSNPKYSSLKEVKLYFCTAVVIVGETLLIHIIPAHCSGKQV